MQKRSTAGLCQGCLVMFALLLGPMAQATDNSIQPYVDQGVPRLVQYLGINTVNPPGNESAGVAYLASILTEANISFETVESAPGRGNIWARLTGTPDADGNKKPGLVLLHHIDVVPANASHWSVDPLSGDIIDGYIFGRGAVDTKGLGIAQLQAFLALANSGQTLNRDVMLMATADEEAGGYYGAGWLVENRREIFDGIGYVLNEGGSGRRYGDDTAVLVEVTQKVPLWLRLKAVGRPGHGSAPQVQTSVTRMVRALKRISETNFPVRVIEPVARMFEGLAPYQASADVNAYANISQAAESPEFMLSFRLRNPGGHALLRNTCSITRLEGSSKINVVPAEAFAELDCRLLPDQDPEQFLSELAGIINDEQIEIEKLMGFTPAISPIDTPLFAAIEAIAKRTLGAPVVPTVAGGFTDSHFFRDLGITSYGYSPFAFAPRELSGIHGNDERIAAANLEQGIKVLYELLGDFVVQQ